MLDENPPIESQIGTGKIDNYTKQMLTKTLSVENCVNNNSFKASKNGFKSNKID